MLKSTQMTTTKVCIRMKLPVPRNWAKRSESRPNASWSNRGSRRRRSWGWSSRALGRVTSATSAHLLELSPAAEGSAVAVTPIIGQQVIEDVVDRDDPEQPVVVIDHRHRNQVVSGQVVRDLLKRGVRVE